MKRDIRYMNSRGLSNQNSVEDWLGGSNFMQDPMEADSNPNFPSSQDWDHYAAWNTNGPHYPVDPKRSPFHSEMTAPSRLGGHYMPYPNMCPRPDGPAPKSGVEPWHYAMPTMTANSSSSGIYSSRNSDAFRPPPHAIPVPQFPRLPQHHLFAPVSGGGPIPSGGGPPSLLPPPFLFTPHHPSSLPSQAYPPHERSSRAHSSASLFGTPGSNYPTMPPVGVNNPDSTNYAEQGCYSLPVTTAACSETQIQISQMIRPKNQVAVSKASVAPTNSEAGKRGCHHRRTLSDPGLVNSLNLSEFTSAPSHGARPPPPPPALRLDAWLKGCRLRDSSEAKLDEPSLSSSMTHDNNHWFHSHEDKKCPQMGLADKGDDEQTPRANMSGQSSMGSDGGLKLSTSAHQPKVVCCCNGWSVPMKLVEEVTALKDSNRKLARELRETRKELDDLKVMLPNADSLKHDGSMSWQYPGVDYRPGMIAELVQELREASRLREEAFLSHVQSAVMSQGASCSCGTALMPDGGGALGAGKRKMMCWWWGKSKWNKPGHPQSASTCSPLSSSDVLQLDQDCEQKKLNMRLRRIEERLNGFKISGETEIPRSNSLQETDFSLSSAKGAKVPPSEDINQRGNVGVSQKEECLNHDIALLKDDIQSLRIELQGMKATQNVPLNQSNKIEQLTALIQKVACPPNGISLSGSAALSSQGSRPTKEGTSKHSREDVGSLANKNISANDSNSDSGKASGCDREDTNSSGSARKKKPEPDVSSSLESDSSNSSCDSNMGITSISSPVTMHGPVTDL